MAISKADLADTPYTFVRRLDPTDIVLAYGDADHRQRREVLERWRRIDRRTVTNSSYWIKVRGRYYRFAGPYRPPTRATRKAVRR